MSEEVLISTTRSVDSLHADVGLQGSDWLRSLSFGDALRQSIRLLQDQFRWLVLLFFIGGTGLTLILFPVNSIIEVIANLLIQEMMNYPPNFEFVVSLMTARLSWGIVQTFLTFFVIFLLNAITIHRVFKNPSTLEVMAKSYQAPHFPSLRIVVAGLLTAGLLAVANLIVVLVPVILFFCFFVPAILIIEGGSLRKAFIQSFEMRHRHSQRILGAILLGATFLLFAHTLGVHLYLSFEFVLQLFGLSLGFGSPVVLTILTQIPVSMVAPLVPLFSIAFYSGARGARAEHKYKRFIRSGQRQRDRKAALIPPDQTSPACRRCGGLLRPNSVFCSQCGTPSTASSTAESRENA